MKKILSKSKTQKLIKEGVDILADTVKVTLGAKGKNVIINNGFEQTKIINDGVSIAREVEVENEIMNTGATLAKQAAEKTNDEAGDGTTTTIVILQEFLKQLELIKATDVRKTRQEINKYVTQIIKYLKIISKKAKKEDIFKIALNSSLDYEIAKTIEKTIEKIGRDGIITIEDKRKQGIELRVNNGIKINDGYVSPYMITDKEKLRAIIKNALVLITTRSINSVNDILPILEFLQSKGINELVIFTDEITDEVLAPLLINKMKGVFSVYIVKTRDIDDISTVTGAQIVTAENGLDFEFDILGKSEKIEINKNNTVVTAGPIMEIKIEEKVKQLKKLLKQEEVDPEDKILAQESIARLSEGVAVISIAGDNAIQTKERKLKLEDSISAVKSALEEGIIVGGGFAFIEAVNFLFQNKEKLNEVETLIYKTMIAPTIQILKNADENEKDIIQKYKKGKGYNVITRKWEDFHKTGIIDPTKVLKSAIINAFAMGTSIATAEASIIQTANENEAKK